MDAAIRIESRYFVKTLMTPQAAGHDPQPVPVHAGAEQGLGATEGRGPVRGQEGGVWAPA
jgi:hypothetical protein